MKMVDAERIMNNVSEGYVVSFEVREGGLLRGDSFPDVHAGERPIEKPETAMELAQKFAHRAGSNVVNIHIADAASFVPVSGWTWLKRYPESVER